MEMRKKSLKKDSLECDWVVLLTLSKKNPFYAPQTADLQQKINLSTCKIAYDFIDLQLNARRLLYKFFYNQYVIIESNFPL